MAALVGKEAKRVFQVSELVRNAETTSNVVFVSGYPKKKFDLFLDRWNLSLHHDKAVHHTVGVGGLATARHPHVQEKLLLLCFEVRGRCT